MALTAKEVANMLGVSQATVSMVLNNKPGISEARKKEIIDKINELDCGYMLKRNGAALKNIGFVVYKRQGDIIDESPFFSYIIEGMNKQAAIRGYQLVMIYINKDMTLVEQIDQVMKSGCEGLIVFATEMFDEDLHVFKRMNLPFVLVDNYFVYENINTVCIDNWKGIHKAVTFLVEKGHTRIGYLQSKININSFEGRFDTYQKVMHDYSLPILPEHVFRIGYSEQQSYQDMKDNLQGVANLPTAIISDNDWLAFGAMRALREHGVRIPEDVSLIGFDDRPICLYTEPQLTTIAVPKDIFGTKAIDLLADSIKIPGKQAVTILLGVELIERGSVMDLV